MTYVIFFIYTSILTSLLFRSRSTLASSISVSLLLATFAALRGSEVASDFKVYEDWYINHDLGEGLLKRPGLFEYLYFLLSGYCSTLGVPFRVFIWIIAFVAIFIKTKVIASFAKTDLAFGISVLIYAFTFYLLHEFTQIRAGIAIAFIFLAIRELAGGSRINFFLLVVFAAAFHSSATVALLLLLPYRSAGARWIDWCLYSITVILVALAALDITAGAVFFDFLGNFDPRIAHYISLAESDQSEAANPLAISAILLLVLALSLYDIQSNFGNVSNVNERDFCIIILIRRSILIGLIFLISLSSIPELALRFFEISISFLPILVAIIFSWSRFELQKVQLFFWASVMIFIYIGRNDGLVQPYVLFFQ